MTKGVEPVERETLRLHSIYIHIRCEQLVYKYLDSISSTPFLHRHGMIGVCFLQ